MEKKVIVYLIPLKKGQDEEKRVYQQRERAIIDRVIKKHLDELGWDEKDRLIEKGRYGKPYFMEHSDVYFNISHCEGMAAVVFSDLEIGIDIEGIREFRERTAQKISDETELLDIQNAVDERFRFFQHWTLKESYIKAIGRGLSYPMDEIHLRFREEKLEEKIILLESEEIVKQEIILTDNEKKIICTDKRAIFYQERIYFAEMYFLCSVCCLRSGRTYGNG